MRIAALAVLLLTALPALGDEVPLPPERPAAGPERTAAPRKAERPPADVTKLAPTVSAIPARRILGGDAAVVAVAPETVAASPDDLPGDATDAPGLAAAGPEEDVERHTAPAMAAPREGPVAVDEPVRRTDRSAKAGTPAPRKRPAEKPARKAAGAAGTSGPPVPPAKPAPEKIRTAMLDRRTSDRPKIGRGEQVVCGDPRLVGRIKPTVTGRHPGCLITDPVEITSIAGIRLSMPATLACPTARTFANWMTGVVDPAAREILGGRIKRIWVMGSFACRTRNSLRGTRLSEHSVGRAMDVGGFTLGNGRKVRVKSDWRKGKAGKFLRRVWKQACGMFKTVLGPDGDRFHQDHLHVDVAYRRASFCR